MKKITIYTDGACRGNGKENALGGYGIVLIDYENKKKKEVKYARRGVTNNIMELSSVIEALKVLKEPCKVQIYSDSKYVVDAFNQKWIIGWRRNNWKKSDKSPVKNQELWQELWHLTQKHDCTFNWVKGHNDNKWNERCDELANIAMDELLASEK
jgi:ribonuclease HI